MTGYFPPWARKLPRRERIIWKRLGYRNRRSLVSLWVCREDYLSPPHVSDDLPFKHICHKEWDVINGAICIPASSAATHEQPGVSGALRVMWWGRRAGFYVRVIRNLGLFCSPNVCKFHLQTLGQSSRRQRVQFSALPALKIFWWGKNTQSFCWRTFQLCAGGDFTKLTHRLSNFHQPHL